jgi:4-hydroxybenzoate polyprenyltransferase
MPPLISLLRPHQWLKNGFRFRRPAVRSRLESDPVKLGQALAAFAAFCLLASAVYVMNDLVDREQDRLHPKKKHRPLAAGTVGARPGAGTGAGLPGRRRRDRLALGRLGALGLRSPTCCSMSATASASSMW